MEKAEYFQGLVTAQRERFHGLCDKYEAVTVSLQLSDDVLGQIKAIVGLTRLLTTDKFCQFEDLIRQSCDENANPPVTSEDLAGFWDMVYRQVENLDEKFEELATLERHNWEVAAAGVVPSPYKPKKKPSARPLAARKPLALAQENTIDEAAKRQQARQRLLLFKKQKKADAEKQDILFEVPNFFYINSPSKKK